MRADRLLSIMLLLRGRGLVSASTIAAELEVSTRTVLRDIEALSTAGVPVYAERGRAGGFALLPGYTTDLTGLTSAEATALLGAGSAGASESLGMAPAFASAMRKVVAAMPDAQRSDATKVAERVLVLQGTYMSDAVRDEHLAVVSQAVFAGRRIRMTYRGRGGDARERDVDPVGLVFAGTRWYLLTDDRTYRLSRIEAAEQLDENAVRSSDVDLGKMWNTRRADFLGIIETMAVEVRVHRSKYAELVTSTGTIVSETEDSDPEWLRVQMMFGDVVHAHAVVWKLGDGIELIGPENVRRSLHERAAAIADRHVPRAGSPTR